jgi:hypothetical protein
LALRAGKIIIFEPKVVIFTTRKYKYLQNLQTSQGYIFLILQHLATNLCSFTHSKTLFLAVMLDFVLLAWLDQNLVYSWNHPFYLQFSPPCSHIQPNLLLTVPQHAMKRENVCITHE